MLVTWLVEIYLNQLGELKEKDKEQDMEYEMIQEEFRKFLNQPRVKVSDSKGVPKVPQPTQGQGE